MNSGSYIASSSLTLWTSNLVCRNRRFAFRRPARATATGLGGHAHILFAVSFPLMAWLVRRLCSRFQLPRDQWLAGAISVALPTLLLDPFSSAFFPVVFPNMAPSVAGVFGGWMLWCCAGALLGVTEFRQRQP